jgi:hypothetical protein
VSVSVPLPSGTGVDHLPFVYETVVPLTPTAMQNDVDGHETPSRGSLATLTGALHKEPSKLTAVPF